MKKKQNKSLFFNNLDTHSPFDVITLIFGYEIEQSDYSAFFTLLKNQEVS